MKIAVLGAAGRMGRLVVGEILDHPDTELVVAIGKGHLLGSSAAALAGRSIPSGPPITSLENGFGEAEVVIDFSLPEGTMAALPLLGQRALVSGTTGLDSEQLTLLHAQSEHGAVLRADNFSKGVNVLLALVRSAAKALPDYDIEIVEAHHRHKIDAPSGTATALAEAAADARKVELEDVRRDGRHGSTGPRGSAEIGLHALRGGSITGHHEVWLAGEGEHLQLTHTAGDRSTFAAGALRAAIWVAGKEPGMYTMAEVLGL